VSYSQVLRITLEAQRFNLLPLPLCQFLAWSLPGHAFDSITLPQQWGRKSRSVLVANILFPAPLETGCCLQIITIML
jgi:hypothetical protein